MIVFHFRRIAVGILSFALLAPAQGASEILSREAAQSRIEMLGVPLNAGTFAHAVATRHRPLIELCFAAGLLVNAPDEAGRTPLLLAALQGDWEVAERLLKAGAAVEVSDGGGVTPLMAAAMQGNMPMLRAFTESGALADTADQRGRAALHYALAASKIEAAQFLLPLSTCLGANTADGTNAVAMAFETGHTEFAEQLLKSVPSTLAWTPPLTEALTAALAAGNKERIRLLLSKHATPPAPAGHTAPLLAYAIAMNDAPLFEILLACGADPNTTIPSPCEKELLALVPKNFLRHYLEGDTGVTVLMLAASLGKESFVNGLLAAGAIRNKATPKHKMIALYFATRTDSYLCTQMLLGSGPSPEELRVEISLSSQEAIVFKNGMPTFRTSCSTGRKGYSTPPGRFVVTDKNRDHRSSIYKVPMPFFMRLSCRDFGLHAGNVPSYPASHGCIRLPSSAARKLFSEIPVGTLVSIN